MSDDVDDADYPRDPADDQGRHPVPPGGVDCGVKSSVGGKLEDEVEALEKVGDGVPKADGYVKEENPDDCEGGESLQEPGVSLIITTAVAAPVTASTYSVTFGSLLTKKG